MAENTIEDDLFSGVLKREEWDELLRQYSRDVWFEGFDAGHDDLMGGGKTNPFEKED